MVTAPWGTFDTWTAWSFYPSATSPTTKRIDPLLLEVWPSLGVLGSAKRKPGTAIRWADKIELKNGASSRRKVFVSNNLGIRNNLK